MGCRASCFGKGFSIGSEKKIKKDNSKKIWWDGKFSTLGQPHGPGIEHDDINNVIAYGDYKYGYRIGTWQFSKDGKVYAIHEYNSKGKLKKITEIRDGLQSIVYSKYNPPN